MAALVIIVKATAGVDTRVGSTCIAVKVPEEGWRTAAGANCTTDAGAPEVGTPAVTTGTLTAVVGTTKGGTEGAKDCKVCVTVRATGYLVVAAAGATVKPAPKVAATKLTAEDNYVSCGNTD